MNNIYIFVFSFIITLSLTGCGGGNDDPAFELKSNSFLADSVIPNKYSRRGGNISPQLEWKNEPSNTKSFAIIMDDLDAKPHSGGKTWVHWNVFNINKATKSLPEDASVKNMPSGSIEGMNSSASARYRGPNPPENDTYHAYHTYHFFVYALNVDNLTIDTSIAFDRIKFEADFSNEIIDKAGFSATFSR